MYLGNLGNIFSEMTQVEKYNSSKTENPTLTHPNNRTLLEYHGKDLYSRLSYYLVEKNKVLHFCRTLEYPRNVRQGTQILRCF